MLAPVAALAQVPYERLKQAETEPSSWLTYSGNYKSHRFSPLTQINRQNVGQLKPAWVYQIRQAGIVETSPIVVDGVMYITEPPSTVTALDVRTGRPLWTWTPTIPKDVIVIGSPPVNRGVAILDDSVFVGTVDGRLFGLDAKSGIVRWEVVVGDNKTGYYLTLAPLALDGGIIVGVSGAHVDHPGAGRSGRRHVGRQQLEDRWRLDVVDRLVRSRAQPLVLGHRESCTRLERRRSAGRQPLYLLVAGPRSGRRQDEVVFPVHAARRARLGFQPDSGAVRRCDRREDAQARRDGEPERVLLRARSSDGPVPDGHPVREADVGEGSRPEGPAHRDSRQRAHH
ncbi:MAG: PQQ-binding-like beta-propeller repeat protein [Acidobacteria bacterium]|nr:PQQ-binding-like beta-propeller repeat protein [Acidobacteriota bacterium]